MYIALLNSIQTFHGHNTISVLSRDRLVVRTLRCGRSNPGSNPGHGKVNFFVFFVILPFLAIFSGERRFI